MSERAAHWRAQLAEWAIPPEILAEARDDPWELPREVFARRTDAQVDKPVGPSYARALEVLDPTGTVLDVGAGAGAASLPLRRRTEALVAVDEDPRMLARLATRAPDATTIAGRWPEAADRTPVADLVVCHHVFYNVPDLADFARALTTHARRRVVVEMTEAHPMAVLNPYWERLHGLARPTGPTAADAVAVLVEAGLAPRTQRWQRPTIAGYGSFDELVDVTGRRLCLPQHRRPELVALMKELDAEHPAPRRMLTIWWSP